MTSILVAILFDDLQAISLRELEDIACLEEKLGRLLSKEERSRIGVSSLRLFLEELLQKRYIRINVSLVLIIFSVISSSEFLFRYMESVPLIIPLLDKEYRSTTRKLRNINQEIRYIIYSFEHVSIMQNYKLQKIFGQYGLSFYKY